MMRDDRGLIYDPEDILIALPPVPAKAAPARPVAPPSVTDAADAEILARLRRMRGGAWGRLYDTGDLAEYGDDWSAADQGLVNGLVAACDGDTTRADHLFRQSALRREKWDERHYADGRTYGQGTLDKALAWYQTTPQTYKPDPIVTINTLPADASTAPCSDAIAALQARIDQLEADVAHWKQRAVQSETMADELRAMQRDSLALRRNKAVKHVAATAEALANEVASVQSRGQVNDDGSVTVPRWVLAENSGRSKDTATKQLTWMHKQGFLKKRTATVVRELVDRETGEADYRPTSEIRITLPSTPRAFVASLAAYTPPESAPRHGGLRLRVPTDGCHPGAKVVKKNHCATCDLVLGDDASLGRHDDVVEPDTTPQAQGGVVESLVRHDDALGPDVDFESEPLPQDHGSEPCAGAGCTAYVPKFRKTALCYRCSLGIPPRPPEPEPPLTLRPPEPAQKSVWKTPGQADWERKQAAASAAAGGDGGGDA